MEQDVRGLPAPRSPQLSNTTAAVFPVGLFTLASLLSRAVERAVPVPSIYGPVDRTAGPPEVSTQLRLAASLSTGSSEVVVLGPAPTTTVLAQVPRVVGLWPVDIRPTEIATSWALTKIPTAGLVAWLTAVLVAVGSFLATSAEGSVEGGLAQATAAVPSPFATAYAAETLRSVTKTAETVGFTAQMAVVATVLTSAS